MEAWSRKPALRTRPCVVVPWLTVVLTCGATARHLRIVWYLKSTGSQFARQCTSTLDGHLWEARTSITGRPRYGTRLLPGTHLPVTDLTDSAEWQVPVEELDRLRRSVSRDGYFHTRPLSWQLPVRRALYCSIQCAINWSVWACTGVMGRDGRLCSAHSPSWMACGFLIHV